MAIDFSNPFKGENADKTFSAIANIGGSVAGNMLSNGMHSNAGDIIQKMSGLASAIPGPWGAAIGAGLNVVGGAVNNLFGEKTNADELKRVNGDINNLNSAAQNAVNATSFDDKSLVGAQSVNTNVNAYKGGIFNKSAKRKNEELKNDLVTLKDYADRSSINTINNIRADQDNNLLANYAAYGGQLIHNYRTIPESNNTILAKKNLNMFDFGGNLQTQGADWSNGMTFINNGGSHETNPLQGVPSGIAPNGRPNLVEEGEVIYKDYVFSNRLTVPKDLKNKYHLKEKSTFADAVKKLSRESEERPNDPISKNGVDSFMTDLKISQEDIKNKKEASKVKKMINNMSPEELQGLGQLIQNQLGNNTLMQYPNQPVMEEEQLPQEGEPQMFKRGGEKAKYGKNWYTAKAKSLGFDLGDDFIYDENSDVTNISNFNNIYQEAQRQKAYNTYINGQRKSWENKELDSHRYKKSDDGKAVYKAQVYTDDDLNKNYISTDGSRITPEEYNLKLNRYNTLKNKKNPTKDEEQFLNDYIASKYKKTDVVKGQIAKDYNGNILYDYINDVSENWIPTDDELGKDFKWDPSEAASVQLPIEEEKSKTSYLRYAPALGGALGLTYDLLSKPDYTNANELMYKTQNRIAPRVEFNPIGNYLGYKPFDINYTTNQLRASEQATNRNILNTSGGNQSMAMAGILANNYNNQKAQSDAYINAAKYNLDQRKMVEEFNRGTNQFNSQGFFDADRANQSAAMQNSNMLFTSNIEAAKMKDNIDARRSASISANMTNLLNSLGQIGEEAYDKDRINNFYLKTGVLQNPYNRNTGNVSANINTPKINDNVFIDDDYLDFFRNRSVNPTMRAYGGKLNKRNNKSKR